VTVALLLTGLCCFPAAARVTKVDPTGSAGDLELWELHEELLREVSTPAQPPLAARWRAIYCSAGAPSAQTGRDVVQDPQSGGAHEVLCHSTRSN
jgi:hypothetical protein